MTRSRMVVLLAALFSALIAVGTAAPPATAAPPGTDAAQVSPPLPTADPFYTPTADYAERAPGSVLQSRVVGLGFRGHGLPASADQVLYRTTDQFGAPVTTVTTLISPPGARPGTPRRVVSYHAFYDALGAQCDPSYTLRGGNDSAGPIDLPMIAGLVAAGFTVAVPDYEGQKLRWTMGLESGYAALDGVRAALRHLRAPAGTPVGLYGYSGGSIPTGFGAELAGEYAPELNIVGAAAGGVLVNPANNLGYVNGSKQWAGVIPALMTVYDETYQLDLQNYLSPKGSQVIGEVQGKCINDFAAQYPGLTDSSLLEPGIDSLLDVPGVKPAIAQNVMGTAGTPRAPMMLGVGNVDGTGDGIMIAADVARLAGSYCKRGTRTIFQQYDGIGHVQALLPWSGQALQFLGERFAGVPVARC